MSEAALAAARALCAQARGNDWTGPDIYDALDARWPGVLVGGRRRRQALLQLHARSPVDLRPLSRRRHARITKGVALFAMAELALDPASPPAASALDLVDGDRTAGDQAWGYPWDVQTRWSHYRRGTPNVIVTSFAVQALLEGARAQDRPGWAERARGGAAWVQRELFLEDLGAYAYHPGSRAVIHNASLLGARCAWARHDDDPGVEPAVRRAVERTLAAQRSDGAFPYGEGPGLEFVDSFHTGYVLECLWDLRAAHAGAAGAVERGLRHYQDRFFDRDGRSLLWPGKRYPEDAHSAGTGMTTLARLLEAGADRRLLQRVTERAAARMVRDGHAVHRRYRWGPTRVRFVRWADAHMALGLARSGGALAAQS